MTLGEFKAWLEGYEEAFPPADDGDHCYETRDTRPRPTADQWERVKAKLAEVTTTVSIPQVQTAPPLKYPDWTRTVLQNGPCTPVGEPFVSSAAPGFGQALSGGANEKPNVGYVPPDFFVGAGSEKDDDPAWKRAMAAHDREYGKACGTLVSE